MRDSIATITARALRAEDALRDVEDALREAIAEIEGSPYQTEPWGWGIAYRIERWRALTRLPERSRREA